MKRKRRRSRERDPLSIYFEEINRRSLLTRERERELAARCREGDAEARKELIESNLRFVVMIAKRFQGKGISLADLIAIGNVGLVEAVDAFDVASHETRFTTYAQFHIQKTLYRAMNEERGLIRFSHHVFGAVRRWRQAVQDLASRSGSNPTDEEVIRHLRVTPAQAETLIQQVRMYDIVIETGFYDVLWKHTPLSSVADSDDMDHVRACAESDARQYDISRIEDALAWLGRADPRAADVLRLRYLDRPGRGWSLDAIGKQYGISKERTRQLESEAIAKIAKYLAARSNEQRTTQVLNEGGSLMMTDERTASASTRALIGRLRRRDAASASSLPRDWFGDVLESCLSVEPHRIPESPTIPPGRGEAGNVLARLQDACESAEDAMCRGTAERVAAALVDVLREACRAGVLWGIDLREEWARRAEMEAAHERAKVQAARVGQ